MCILFVSSVVNAGDVLVVLSKSSKPYQVFYQYLVRSLNETGNGLVDTRMIELRDFNKDSLFDSEGKKYKLVVTAGSKAARAVATLDVKIPVLFALLPQRSYQSIIKDIDRDSRARYSAMFIDQPISRKFDLIRAALPEYRNVGVILGPATRYKNAELKRIASRKNIKLDTKNIKASKGLLNALNEVLDSNEVLLTIADPVVVNRSTLQSLFMTSYMKRIPVIGYSRAYVRAGALLAVYSTPEQLGRQAGEMIGRLFKPGNVFISTASYPKYYSISVNVRVAKSLGLLLKDEQQIQTVMQSMENGS